MPRRNVLSARDTNPRTWPPPGVVLSHGTWGIASIDPNYKAPAAETTAESFPSNAKQKGTKRKSDSTDDKGSNATGGKSTKKEAVSKHGKDKNNLVDVSSMWLDREEDEEVPIYATATDIRRELTALLQTPGVSAAGLCRTLSAVSGTSVSAGRLNTFRNKGKKGGGSASVDGADSPVFYAAYVYLEKVRVLTGGKKSKHRLEMEEAWGEDGMCRRGLQTYIIMAGQSLEYDRLGRMVLGGHVCDHSQWRVLGSAFGF